MKKRTQGFVLGVLAAFILSTAVNPALASLVGRQITAFFGIKLIANGTEVVVEGLDGTPAEVFSYNGRTYVPVAFLRDIGITVDWEAETNTVYVGGVVEQAAREVPLYNRTYLQVGNVNGFSVSGNASDGTRILIFPPSNTNGQNLGNSRYRYSNYVVYPLNGAATKFTADLCRVFANSYSNRNPELMYYIYGDDVLLYTSPIMTEVTSPIAIDLDVSGRMTLKIETVLTTSDSSFSSVNSSGVRNAVIVTTDY
ncbi:MAG: NPCBM/NEW2 domain-containing protein [Oscillospiraceae bacterium]|nr:NPCBM/NEW2 domain-containing protein [Oscillospiraceae bacterium]